MKWCPNQFCENIISLKSIDDKEGICIKCETKVCVKCGRIFHGEVECKKMIDKDL